MKPGYQVKQINSDLISTYSRHNTCKIAMSINRKVMYIYIYIYIYIVTRLESKVIRIYVRDKLKNVRVKS